MTPEERDARSRSSCRPTRPRTLQLGFTHDNGWETALIVRNLFDERGFNYMSSSDYSTGLDEAIWPWVGETRVASTCGSCSGRARSACRSARSGDAAAPTGDALRPGGRAGSAVKLVTTSVVRGSHQGESHGGVYLHRPRTARRRARHSTGTRPPSTGRAAAGTAACAASPSTARSSTSPRATSCSPTRRISA